MRTVDLARQRMGEAVTDRMVSFAEKLGIEIGVFNKIRSLLSSGTTPERDIAQQLGVDPKLVTQVSSRYWTDARDELKAAGTTPHPAKARAKAKPPPKPKAKRIPVHSNGTSVGLKDEVRLFLGNKDSAASIAERLGISVEQVNIVKESEGVPKGLELEKLRTRKAKQELADARKETATLRLQLERLERSGEHLEIYVINQDNVSKVLEDAAHFLGVQYVLKRKDIPKDIAHAIEKLRRRATPLEIRRANDEANKSEGYDAARFEMFTNN